MLMKVNEVAMTAHRLLMNANMASQADKRSRVAVGLSEKFERNPDYYSRYSSSPPGAVSRHPRNFMVGLGAHTMPVFLFKGWLQSRECNLCRNPDFAPL